MNREVNMEYKAMIPPFEIVRFEEMNKKQTNQYFDWFCETKEERLRKLQEFINRYTNEVLLDKSPESLIKLWRWFQQNIEVEEKTESEIQDELNARPDWMRKHVLENTKKFSIQTRRIAFDISIYLGEVLIKSNPTIHWGFQGDISVYPYRLLDTCLWKSLRGEDELILYRVYNVWITRGIIK